MSRAQKLRDVLDDGQELNIVCHNNPDPDCLASALALGRIAAHTGIDERHIVYSGDISHQQNRAFVNLLDIDLEPFDPTAVQNRPADSCSPSSITRSLGRTTGFRMGRQSIS